MAYEAGRDDSHLVDDDDDDFDSDIVESSLICCDPGRRCYRYFAFVFICFLCFGNYFVYDNPAALEDDIISNLNITKTEYGLFYSMYSWPNTFLSLFGGFLIDRVLGIRLAGVAFAAIIMAGQLIFSIGAAVNLYPIMVLGRLIFAIGGENIAVAQNAYCVKWFKGNELNTVFGIQLSFARIGSTVNMYVMEPLLDLVQSSFPHLAGYKAVGFTLLLGGLTTVLSFLCSIILSFLDRKNDKYKKNKEHTEFVKEGEVVRIRDVTKFPLTFWLLCIICVTYYAAIFPYVSYAQDFYVKKFHMSKYHADILNSLIYLISIVASPIFGSLVDCIGRNVYLMMISCLFTMASHVLLGFTDINPYFAVVMIGINYSLMAASLWAPVGYLVPAKCIGTAYGIMQSIQNLGLAIVFQAAGPLADGGYPLLQSFFVGCLEVCFAMILCVLVADRARSGILNMGAKQRLQLIKMQEEAIIS